MASSSQANGAEPQKEEPEDELPPIHAAFLIRFDIRKGYTIAWKKALPHVNIDGAVEFKSLPSGLHNVQEDLVYFRHEDHIGLSAFVNEPADEASRNALMFAVGVLLPTGKGRMNKSWRYAEPLRNLAKELASQPEKTSSLETFWEQRKSTEITQDDMKGLESSEDNTNTKDITQSKYNKTRGMSDVPLFLSHDRSLSGDHPATSIPNLLETFGPLLFPLYRAALLRKRILILGEAPVRTNCHFVYDLSILASIPSNILPFLPYDRLPDLHMKSLFNVGIYDIPSLSPSSLKNLNTEFSLSWVACTTDDVLATKPELYDVLVRLPPSHARDAPSKIYPEIKRSHPSLATSYTKATQIKATQRDARRYRNLRYNLQRRSSEESEEVIGEHPDIRSKSPERAPSTFSASSVVEPTSWSHAAYTSLIWWASAGEKGSPSEQEEAEIEEDQELLSQDNAKNEASPWPPTEDQSGKPSTELAVITYFQRLTSLMVSVLSDAIERQDRPDQRGGRSRDPQDSEEQENENEEQPLISSEEREDADIGEREDPVDVTNEDFSHMGLDPWSVSDRQFVEEMLQLWWGRRANSRGGRIECCGIRLR